MLCNYSLDLGKITELKINQYYDLHLLNDRNIRLERSILCLDIFNDTYLMQSVSIYSLNFLLYYFLIKE
jgi:hypothetical protein